MSREQQIFRFVAQCPGSHLRAIARAVGLQPNVAKHHLQRMERAGRVRSRRDDTYLRFWPAGARLEEAERTASWALRDGVPKRVAAVLLTSPDATRADLAAQTGCSPSSVYYHVRRLQDAGVLEVRRKDRRCHYRLREPERVARLLRPPVQAV